VPRLPSILRAIVVAALVLGLVGAATPAGATQPWWKHDIDVAVSGHDVSVAIGLDGAWLYRHDAWRRRAPASNQKLVFSMALLHETSLSTRVRTRLFSTRAPGPNGTLRGNLWIVGHGDPEVDRPAMGALARAARDAGIETIRGRVMASTGPFRRDWWARGWRDYFPRDYIALPTALTFEQNQNVGGVHITDPERRAATSLTNKLRALGLRVTGDPGAGTPPAGLRDVATIRSEPFEILLRKMNRRSRNFYAEVLGKWLGARVVGGAGSIAKAATAIERFADGRGVDVVAYDASGLSYRNRVSARELVRLLWFADSQPWGPELRAGLPTGDQGTLEDRLVGVRVHAKTGTLIEISALSGWVWLDREGRWGEFSILSRGMSKAQAAAIEDRIVRIVASRAFAASRALSATGRTLIPVR
jgi:D-alanyl-D-alanine carboxypeptidase/D-alanyl-D-alanine-endopeptidase (penicillin-binding protein 4)